MKNEICILGWEKYGLDEKGERYLKERHVYQFALICRNVHMDIKEGKYAKIYEINDMKQHTILSKIYLEKGDTIDVVTGHM